MIDQLAELESQRDKLKREKQTRKRAPIEPEPVLKKPLVIYDSTKTPPTNLTRDQLNEMLK